MRTHGWILETTVAMKPKGTDWRVLLLLSLLLFHWQGSTAERTQRGLMPRCCCYCYRYWWNCESTQKKCAAAAWGKRRVKQCLVVRRPEGVVLYIVGVVDMWNETKRPTNKNNTQIRVQYSTAIGKRWRNKGQRVVVVGLEREREREKGCGWFWGVGVCGDEKERVSAA